MHKNQCIKVIANQLESLGVKKGGILLVHSSMRALGEVDGGIETLIKGIKLALGPDGTLLMPALSYKYVDGEIEDTFSVKDTSVNIGAIPEYFRKMPGVIRSIHPTHSVCGEGKYAQELLGRHEQDHTPCGPNSPFKLLSQLGGQILFIGCGLKPNTSMHGIEELVEPEYLFKDEFQYKLFNENREKRYAYYTRHNFEGVEQRYDRLNEVLDENDLKVGRLLEAECHLVEAGPMWKKVLDVLKEDSMYFVDVINRV